ncbi:MAG TPA: tripartite tricarboxylate transporter substrate binding protein [Burkholderiales bacterium]|nr:tripartite tricarboxylate transporter substrate binding protein [Burkholderiales bacterium]
MKALRGHRATILCTALAALAHPAGAQQPWQPARNVEIIVNSGAGGAADRQARAAQRYLQTFPGVPSVTVVNKPGGGGTVALSLINERAGDGHFIGVLSTGLVTNRIVGISAIGYEDVTPLNIVLREYVVAWTHVGSPIASGQDLVARLKRDPSSVSFGFATAPGNQNHIVIGMIARTAGVDAKAVKAVIYASGGQGITSALGGHVDVWVGTAGGTLPHVQSGKVRVLGVSSEQRQPGVLAASPTFREQSIDATYFAWRGFLGPRGMTAAQVAYWDQAFAKIVADDTWKETLDRNAWVADSKLSADARSHLEREHKLLSKILADLGLAKSR